MAVGPTVAAHGTLVDLGEHGRGLGQGSHEQAGLRGVHGVMGGGGHGVLSKKPCALPSHEGRSRGRAVLLHHKVRLVVVEHFR